MIIDVRCFEHFPLVSLEIFHRVICPWCIWCYSSMYETNVLGKVCKTLTVKWRSVISTQFVGDPEVRQVPFTRMMVDSDVDVTISTARKQEYRHCTTSMYSLLVSSLKRSAPKCLQNPFGSSVILNSFCCLVLVTAWQGRNLSTEIVNFLLMPGNHMCSLAYCFVFTNP